MKNPILFINQKGELYTMGVDDIVYYEDAVKRMRQLRWILKHCGNGWKQHYANILGWKE